MPDIESQRRSLLSGCRRRRERCRSAASLFAERRRELMLIRAASAPPIDADIMLAKSAADDAPSALPLPAYAPMLRHEPRRRSRCHAERQQKPSCRGEPCRHLR